MVAPRDPKEQRNGAQDDTEIMIDEYDLELERKLANNAQFHDHVRAVVSSIVKDFSGRLDQMRRLWRLTSVIFGILLVTILGVVFFRSGSAGRYEYHPTTHKGISTGFNVFDKQTGTIVNPAVKDSTNAAPRTSVEELPGNLLSKITGQLAPGSTSNGQFFVGKLYNGTECRLREMTIEITAQPKGGDQWTRVFKESLSIPPSSAGNVSIDVAEKRTIDSCKWRIVSAKGTSSVD